MLGIMAEMLEIPQEIVEEAIKTIWRERKSN